MPDNPDRPKTTPEIAAAISAAEDAIEWKQEAMSTLARWAVGAFLRGLPEGSTVAIAAHGERRIRTAWEVAEMVDPTNGQ